MNIDIKEQKTSLRKEAKRARSLFEGLDKQGQEALCKNFFDNIEIDKKNCVVASYWPVGRELDTSVLMEKMLARGMNIALPVVQKGTRILRFAQWSMDTLMCIGSYNIPYPDPDDDNICWLEPDIFLVPTLVFDRKGYRLGYGGGYYDTTLAYYRECKNIAAVGIAYARQACLFNLPLEEHDQKMDWVITEQNALRIT